MYMHAITKRANTREYSFFANPKFTRQGTLNKQLKMQMYMQKMNVQILGSEALRKPEVYEAKHVKQTTRNANVHATNERANIRE
jgi:hypothetical protein